MTKNETDINLIKNILMGDKSAQNKFYDRYKRILTDYINSKYHNNIDIEDDVSEILIKIFNNLTKYDKEKASVLTWVITIARNHMTDKFRCSLTGVITVNADNNITFNNCDISGDSTYFDPDLNNVSYTVSSDIPQFETSNAVNFISSQLNSCDFTFLDMHYNYGYSYSEIGSEFNLTSNTISNRVNYLKTKLKKSIKEELID